MVQVCYDGQIFQRERVGGISRYFVELYGALQEDPSLGIDPSFESRWSLNAFAGERGLTKNPRIFVDFKGLRRLSSAANRIACNALNRSWSRHGRTAEIRHVTYYEKDALKRIVEPYLACTIYDMTPELLPDFFPHGNPHMSKALYVQKADLIFCISETTKRDLLAHYGSIQGAVVVAPLAVSEFWSNGEVLGHPTGAHKIVYVGGRSGYKDFETLLRALSRLPRSFTLTAVGGGSFNRSEIQACRTLGILDRVSQQTMPDKALRELYAQSTVYVSTSRYEGFGLGTLEAMASGCPCLLSRIPAHLEVGAGGAKYFDPGDEFQLAEQILKLADCPSARESQIVLGRLNAERYGWRSSAQTHAYWYRKIAS